MELKNVEIIKIGELKTFDSGFYLINFLYIYLKSAKIKTLI